MVADGCAEALTIRPAAPGTTNPCPDRAAPAFEHLALVLDELDYGIVVLDLDGRVLLANYRARAELQADHALILAGDRLKARRNQDNNAFAEALAAATQRGLRRLVEMSCADKTVSVAVVPLSPCAGEKTTALLVLIGRRHICEGLSVQSFARASRLTGMETRVLEGLCTGVPVSALARIHGVAISTVRSHIASIRAKTGARTVQELVRRVAALPPLVSVLRAVPAATDADPLRAAGWIRFPAPNACVGAATQGMRMTPAALGPTRESRSGGSA